MELSSTDSSRWLEDQAKLAAMRTLRPQCSRSLNNRTSFIHPLHCIWKTVFGQDKQAQTFPVKRRGEKNTHCIVFFFRTLGLIRAFAEKPRHSLSRKFKHLLTLPYFLFHPREIATSVNNEMEFAHANEMRTHRSS